MSIKRPNHSESKGKMDTPKEGLKLRDTHKMSETLYKELVGF